MPRSAQLDHLVVLFSILAWKFSWTAAWAFSISLFPGPVSFFWVWLGIFYNFLRKANRKKVLGCWSSEVILFCLQKWFTSLHSKVLITSMSVCESSVSVGRGYVAPCHVVLLFWVLVFVFCLFVFSPLSLAKDSGVFPHHLLNHSALLQHSVFSLCVWLSFLCSEIQWCFC